MIIRVAILLLLVVSLKVDAQTKEFGVLAGYTNLLSDIGYNNPISPIHKDNQTKFNPALGFFYKKTLNNKVNYKLSFLYANLPSNDLNSASIDRQARGLSTNSELYEGSFTLEMNFFNIYGNLYKSTPYIFAGVGGFLHRDFNGYNLTFQRNVDSSGSPLIPTLPDDYSTTERVKVIQKPKLMIPFGLGYKFKIKNKFMLGIEYGFRVTFYDNLDNSSPQKVDIIQIEPDLLTSNPSLTNDISNSIKNRVKSYTKGNTNNNDYYSYTGITFSYLFGEPPCYCK